MKFRSVARIVRYWVPRSALGFLFALLCPTFASSQSSSLVWLSGGSLQYQPFAMTGQSNAVNVIPDFSHAGYDGGGVAIPTLPVVRTLTPSGGDDTQQIQDAIDYAEGLSADGNGFRGAVLLTAGCYEVDQLYIEQGGVVLRGEGQGLDGTILFATRTSQHDVITVRGTGSGFQRSTSSRQDITTSYVPVGAYNFDIQDGSAYSVGETIVVRRTLNQAWIDDLGMDEATLCADDPSGCGGWTPSSYSIYHERVITGINGNTITINLPIVDVIETQYGGGEIYRVSIPGRIEQCGVENLRITSYYDPTNDEDENHAWVGVKLSRVVNSWVTNVTGEYLGYGTVSITGESNFNTIQECACIDHKSRIAGSRRYSFNISDGVGNLFQRNYTRSGRHDFVTGSRVTGPNVFLDNYSTQTYSDIGPHHRWATGLLFDNVRGGQIRVQNRGSSGSGHGWAGNTNMFWNLLSVDDDIKVESPIGGMNWGIGCRGSQQNGAGYWDNWNTAVQPRSLYLQQLEDRLGSQAVANVTISAQRSGDIYSLLANWAGEGDLLSPSAPSSKTVFVSEDAFIRAGSNSNTNYGADDELAVKMINGTTNNDRVSFLKFDLSGETGPIWNVRLRLYVSNDAPNPAQCALHLVSDDSWSENTVTWNNQPNAGSLIDTKAVPDEDNWLEYDITNVANSELNGDGILSLRLSEVTIDNLFEFWSKERNDFDLEPRLIFSLEPGGVNTQGCSVTALPVNWTYFTTRPQANSTLLQWGTSQEENHDHFIVEHSTDAKVFNPIGEVHFPEREEASQRHYDFVHSSPTTGSNYYRLRQVDTDGTASYSVIRSVFFTAEAKTDFVLFPNPTMGNLHFRLPVLDSPTEVRIYSAVGQLLLVQPVTSTHLELPTHDFPAGFYWVIVNGRTQQWVKQ